LLLSRITQVVFLSLPMALMLGAVAQSPSIAPLPIPEALAMKLDPALPVIRQNVRANEPFSVTGVHGALLGDQSGESEMWLYPWKIFSGLKLTVQMDNYGTPIEVNPHAARIEVRPDATTITYTHANFTLRQQMIAPRTKTGAVILFSMDAVRPLTLTLSLKPTFAKMWPAPNAGPVSAEWIETGKSGYYMLHLALPDHTAALALPGATAGEQMPYQEREREAPVVFHLRYDPAQDKGKIYPLVASVDKGEWGAREMAESLRHKLDALPAELAATTAYYHQLLADAPQVETPDSRLNQAYQWAVVAMDQLRVETGSRPGESAYTAGVLKSSDSLRPGYGWFFGRDALWTLYAINATGQFARTREELDFLLARQSAEGKILHEWSQTADEVKWRDLPYPYAEADATLLLQMVARDTLRTSGDRAYLESIWPKLLLAWHYQTTHDADGDGIYDNAQGTGWVESWPGGMPKQEIYLAALDVESAQAFAELAASLGHKDLADAAKARATQVAAQIEKEYLLADKSFYAFSVNGSKGADAAATIFPAVAWWDGGYNLQHSAPLFSRWASSEFSTDWGTRLVSNKASFYDPISYHQGSVWPLFTGWVALAEYRAGRPMAGFAHLAANANLTWAQDLGTDTEVLSGDLMKPIECSSAHQLWSSAMVVTPLLRGLFGLDWDAEKMQLTVRPQLPASWNEATLRHLSLGSAHFDLHFLRTHEGMLVEALGAPQGMKLLSDFAGTHGSATKLMIPLEVVEAELDTPAAEEGSTTRQLKVLSEQHDAHRMRLTVEGLAGESYHFTLRENTASALPIVADGVQLGEQKNGLRTVTVHFAGTSGFVQKQLEFRW